MNPDIHLLPNGVRLVLDPMPGLESAAIGVWLKTGARVETPQLNGLAHLVEHMAFKGAGGRGAQAIAEAFENMGASVNAATGYERTSYFARCLSEHAVPALELIADLVAAPEFDASELKREKDVVIQEIGEAADDPNDRVFELAQTAAFADQALGRPILGVAETLAAMRVEDLQDYAARSLDPSRLVVCAAGAFDAAALQELVARRFGGLAGRAAETATGPAAPWAPAFARAGAMTETRTLEQAHLVFSSAAPPAGDPRGFAARIFAEILGGGMASRLFQDLREKRGLAYAIEAYVDVYEDVGRLAVYAGCAPQRAGEIGAGVLRHIEDLAQTGPTAPELRRAKAVMTASLLMGVESPLARCELAAGQILLRGRVWGLAELRAEIAKVDADAVQAMARLALTDRTPAASALGPKRGLKAAEAFVAALR